MKKRFLSVFLVLAMLLSLVPTMSFAALAEEGLEPVKYIERAWDGEKIVETEKECADYIVVDANTTAFENGNWYVVNGEVTVSGRIVVSGTANLILCDGCTLNANSGIRLFEGNALNIYGQSADSGKLNAKASYVGNSGIGGNQNDGNGGDLTVYGGSIYASGMVNAAGIGGGWRTSGGSFTMYGGSVEAQAGNQYAAAIGKGRFGSQGSFTVYGTPHIYAGDTNPGSETTVAGYESSRNSYVNIIYTGHIHTWLDATCTEPQTCSECGEKVGLPLGHTWVKGDMVSEATCTQPAVYRYECSLCHETKNIEFGEKAAHHFVNNVCTECGVRVEEFVIDEDGVLTAYNGDGGDVVIPEGVTAIGDYAFDGCSNLTEVTIPESVTSIGDYAFGACYDLTEVTISEGVTSIGYSAFGNCFSLTEVTIPESVTSIGDYAFENCSELQTVTITDNIKSVGEDVFDVANIRTVNYPCGDDLDIIKAYFGDEVFIGTTYNVFHVYSAQGTLVSAATCTQPAVYTAKCKGCDLVQGTMDVGEPLGHTWVTGDLVSEATCTDPAAYNRECSVCHATDTIEIGELGDHNWQDANCTEPKTCSVCHITEGIALGHTWVDANCTEPKTCSVCHVTEAEPLGHTWVTGDLVSEATCLKPAVYNRECSVCHATDTIEVGDPLGHSFVFDSKGVAKCKRCSFTPPAANITTNIDSCNIAVGDIIKAGVVIKAYENNDDAYMAVHVDGKFVGAFTPYKKYTTPTCLKCVSKSDVDNYGNFDIEFESACLYNAATCQAPATCIYCGATKGEIGSHNVVNGVCTVCGVHFEAFEFDAKSLALDSALAFKFKGYLHDENPAAEAYMEFKIGNIRTVNVPLNNAVKDEKGRYVFTCYLNVLEVDEKIEAIFHDGEVSVERENPLSVTDYLDKVLDNHKNGTAEDTVIVNLVNAISNYAHYAQIALDETHTEYEVGNGGKYVGTDARTAITLHSADELERFAATKTVADGFADVKSTSRSLVLDDETAIVLYITPANADYVPAVKVTDKNGDNVAVECDKQANGKWRIVIRGIAAHMLGSEYTVDIDDGKLTYTNLSALSYAYSILSSSKSEAYKNAVSALYDYYLATVAYKN